jgi:hypothetical protein
VGLFLESLELRSNNFNWLLAEEEEEEEQRGLKLILYIVLLEHSLCQKLFLESLELWLNIDIRLIS